MLDCGSFSMDDVFGAVSFSPLLPAATLRVDQSSFTQLPVEEQLRKTQRDLEQLKEAFGLKLSDTEDMAQELQFFKIKNEELMDVIKTSRCPSDANSEYTKSYELMKLKSHQNSELTLTVQKLRDLLDKSGNEISVQQQKVQDLSRQNESLSSIKKSNQHLHLQLKGLLKTVNNCADVHSSVVDIPSEWMNAKWMMMGSSGPAEEGQEEEESGDNTNTNTNTIQMITRKIITMEADRQRLLKQEALAVLIHSNTTQSSGDDTTEQEKEEHRSITTITATTSSLEQKLRQQHYEQEVLQETNSALRRQLSVREGKILALEELFQNINASRSIEGGIGKGKGTGIHNIRNHNNSVNRNKNNRGSYGRGGSVLPFDSQDRLERSVSLIDSEDDDSDSDVEDDDDSIEGDKKQEQPQSFEVIFTNIWTAFSTPVENMQHRIIGNSNSNSNSNDRNRDDRNKEKGLREDDGTRMDQDENDLLSCGDLSTVTGVSGGRGAQNSSYHTRQVEEELQAAAQQDYEELQHSHFQLTKEYEASQVRTTDLTAQLEESIIKATSCEKKAELREGLLRDVIQQYKELETKHSTSKHQLQTVKQKVVVLLQLEQERSEEKKKEIVVTTSINEGINTDGGVSKEGVVEDEDESPTVDMSDDSSSTDSNNENEEDGSLTSTSSSSSSSVYTTTNIKGGIDNDNVFMMADNKRLEWECDKLQHEFETAISNITSLEEQLQEAKTQTYETQQVSTKKAHTIVVLEKEKAALQERIIEVTTNIVDTKSTHTRQSIEVDGELKLAELRYQQARDKQQEREQDLWDVIEQYKQLAETNDSTTKEKAQVEHELRLTQKVKCHRRDLVYEYRKLEKGTYTIRGEHVDSKYDSIYGSEIITTASSVTFSSTF